MHSNIFNAQIMSLSLKLLILSIKDTKTDFSLSNDSSLRPLSIIDNCKSLQRSRIEASQEAGRWVQTSTQNVTDVQPSCKWRTHLEQWFTSCRRWLRSSHWDTYVAEQCHHVCSKSIDPVRTQMDHEFAPRVDASINDARGHVYHNSFSRFL